MDFKVTGNKASLFDNTGGDSRTGNFLAAADHFASALIRKPVLLRAEKLDENKHHHLKSQLN